MNKIGKKYFKSMVDRSIANDLSGFIEWKEKSNYLWPGELAYYKPIKNIFFFLVFSPHQQDRRIFTIDIGWSRLRRFPEIDMRPCGENPFSDVVLKDEEEFFTRLGALMGKDDYWWRLSAGHSESEVDIAVSEAITKIKEFALPYFEKIPV